MVHALASNSHPHPDLVIVVDDNPDIVDVFTCGLSARGFDVHGTTDARTCVELAVELVPAAMVIDIAMPDISGWQLARRLRNLPQLHHPRLVAVSALSDPVHRARSLAAGFEAHLVKPCALDELVRALRSP